MKDINFYSTLDLPNFSNVDIIKSKYKELVKIHHPDKGGNSDILDKIVLAYDYLKDPKKKSEFDRKLKYKVELYEKAEELSIYDYLKEEDNSNSLEYGCMQCFSVNKVENIREILNNKNAIEIVKCENCSMIYKLVS